MPPVSALAVAIGLAAAGQPDPAAAPGPRMHIVAADAGGQPAEQLRPQDVVFVLDGIVRPVARLRLVRAGGDGRSDEPLPAITSRAVERAEAAREGARLFAIFLDEYHVTAGEPAARARDALLTFVDQQLGPRDLVVVLKPLDSLLEIRLTRDRESLKRVISTFAGRMADFEARTPFERDYLAGTPERVRRLRAQVAASALHALARHLGDLTPARKTLILVSEGFVPDRRAGDALPTLDTVIRTAARAGVAVYVVDPAGPGPGGASGPAQGRGRGELRRVAVETGGEAISDPAAMKAGLERIAREASVYYELEPALPAGDPAADAGAVEVRAARRGLTVRAPGRLLVPTRAPLAPIETRPAAIPVPARHASPLIRPWFGVARGEQGRMRVRFVWEPVSPVPGARERRTPTRVTLTVTDAQGTPLAEVVSRDVAAAAAGDRRGLAVFEVPAGRVQLLMSIEDPGSRLLDTDVRDLPVSALTGPVALGTPEVFRARTARAFRATASDPDAVPVATRSFARTERLLVRVPAYADSADLALSARLVSRIGGSMRDLAVVAGPAGHSYQLDLPLASLAAGEYAIEISATTSAGTAAERVSFRVVP